MKFGMQTVSHPFPSAIRKIVVGRSEVEFEILFKEKSKGQTSGIQQGCYFAVQHKGKQN